VFEPFVLRNNSRVFLETTAVLPVLVGLLLAAPTVWLCCLEVGPSARGTQGKTEER